MVDGDEIFHFRNPQRVMEIIGGLEKGVCRVEATIRDFVNDANLVARERVSGKFWRTGEIIFGGEYPFEYPELRSSPKSDYRSFSSSVLKDEAICYHMVFFSRSSKDSDVWVGRHWRKLPFPILPFFGPYPKNFPVKGNLLAAMPKFFFYNAVALLQMVLHKREQKKDARSGRKLG